LIVCKVCGATNEQGATFCGTCGSFLEWSGEAVQPDGSTQPQGADGPPPVPPGPSGPSADASTGDTTAIVTPIAATAETAPPGSIICPNCGQANDPTRVYCSRCATELAPVVAATDQVVAAPPTSRSIPPVAIAGVIGAVALLAILAFVLLPKGSPAPSSEAAITEVPSAVVASNPPSIEASSSPAGSASAGVESPSPSSEASAALPVPTGRIAFQARTNGNTDVMVWSADTGAIVKLAGGKGDQSEPAWDPDGKRIVYVNNIPPFSPNGGTPDEGLRVVKDDGSPASVFDFTHHDVDRNPAWSPDGGAIVFSSTRDHTQNKNLDIYSRVYEVTTTEDLLVDNPADDFDPAWSPDGNRIVFVSTRNGDDHLFTMRPNGNGQVALKLGNGVFDDPVYSPDGEKLAFTRRDNPNAQKQLFVANADGSDMTQVGSFDADVSDPTWSPDSALIAVTRGIPGAMIVIVDAATGAQVDEFGVDGASVGQADWR
jgi:dipeptidyl aminopeptidase/acylaminoacyl peptidase